MTRRNLRENIFKILFGMEFNTDDEMQEQTELALEGMEGISDEASDYIRDKVLKIVSEKEFIDGKLEEALEGWSLSRIGKAELAILRLAVYEIFFDDTVPYKVAVNEAVELSKMYCNSEAKSFVNGVLSKFDSVC